MKKLLVLRYWILGGVTAASFIGILAYQQHGYSKKYRHHRTEYCSTITTTAEQKKACLEEHTSALDYLPWWYELVSWPEGITTWGILLTFGAITWQVWETRKAATATEQASQAALFQIRLTKEKERACVEVKGGKLHLETTELTSFWYLTATIDVRNIGSSRAFIKGAKGYMTVREDSSMELPNPGDEGSQVDFSTGFVDPSPTLEAESKPFHFFPDDSRALVVYATKIFEGGFTPHIRGFIEYESLGVRFIRPFSFDWISGKNNFYFAMQGAPDSTDSKSRIEQGYWRESDEGNEEIEIAQSFNAN